MNVMTHSVVNALWTCVVIAMAASSISYTITQTELFAPLRQWSHKLGAMTAYLMACFYCMSHWVVAAAILIYQPVLIASDYWVVDLIVSAFFTITLTAVFSGCIFKVFLVAMAMKLKQKEAKALLAQK